MMLLFVSLYAGHFVALLPPNKLLFVQMEIIKNSVFGLRFYFFFFFFSIQRKLKAQSDIYKYTYRQIKCLFMGLQHVCFKA